MQLCYCYPTASHKINQHFLNNPDFYKQFGIEGHEGLDLFAPTGAEIYACADGEVYMVHRGASDHNYGIHVRIQHIHEDGVFKTIYAHFQTALVKEGDKVRAGDVIGLADSTGNSTGSHLHLTLKRDGATALGESTFISKEGRRVNVGNDIIDPTPFLDPQPDNIPSRPALANHPSSELLGGQAYNPPGGKIAVTPDVATVGGGSDGLILEFIENGQPKSYTINASLKLHIPTTPPQPGSSLLQSDPNGQVHTLKINELMSVVIQGSLPWVEPPKPTPSSNIRMRVISSIGINVRREPLVGNNLLVKLPKDFELMVTPEVRDDGTNVWRQITGNISYQGVNVNGGWLAEKQSDGDPVYLTKI
jgi:Peptidase family M23